MTRDAPTSSKPFKCTLCPLEYTSNQGLKYHTKNKHPKDIDNSQTTQLVTDDSSPAPASIDPTPALTSDPTLDLNTTTQTAPNEEQQNTDEEIMKEFENEIELYEQIEQLSQAEIETGKEDKAKAKIAEKLV